MEKCSLVVGLFLWLFFSSLFCVWFRLPGWSVGLHVAVAGTSVCLW